MRIKSLNLHFIKNSLKGYKSILRTRSLFRVRDLKNALAETSFVQSTYSAFSNEACISHLPHERVLRQYIYKTYMKNLFLKLLFYSTSRNKKLVYPMPKAWLRVISEKNFPINYRLSIFAWYGSLSVLFLYNIYKSILFLLKAIRLVSYRTRNSRYTYFLNLSEKNIPYKHDLSKSYTIIDWYLNWSGRSNISTINHDLEISSVSIKSIKVSHGLTPYFLIQNYYSYFKLTQWFFHYLTLAFIDLISGKWWSLLLIYELLLAKSTSLCPSSLLADDYMFHYSGLIYRPLWTYIAEEKGSRIISYFYSSYQSPSTNSSHTHDSASWPASTWSHHLVWDSHQKSYLEENLNNKPKLEIVGSIWFSDTNITPTLPERSIAVFPIEFARFSYFMPTSTYGDFLYENPDYFEHFIGDILSILEETDYSMILKLKRDRPKNEQVKNNLSFISKLKNNDKVIIIDSDTSPIKLFHQCQAVISMPFTSFLLKSLSLFLC